MSDWQTRAGCLGHDADLWFSHDPTDTAEARRICDTLCPVKDACLDYALATDQRHGIWGGTAAPQRRRLRTGGESRPCKPQRPARLNQRSAPDSEPPVPMADVDRQPDGVFADAAGSITIVPVDRAPRWIVIVDDHVVARCDTLDEGRIAARQALDAVELAAEAAA